MTRKTFNQVELSSIMSQKTLLLEDAISTIEQVRDSRTNTEEIKSMLQDILDEIDDVLQELE